MRGVSTNQNQSMGTSFQQAKGLRPAPSPLPPSRDRTIARLSDEITRLTEENTNMKRAIKRVGLILFCWGGPLNSNIDQYSKKQLYNFSKIKEAIDL